MILLISVAYMNLFVQPKCRIVYKIKNIHNDEANLSCSIWKVNSADRNVYGLKQLTNGFKLVDSTIITRIKLMKYSYI